MRGSSAVVVGLLAALLFISLAIYFAASSSILGNPDDFGPANTSWNGLSTVVSMEHPIVIRSLSSLPPDGTGFVLLENGPTNSFTPAEARDVSNFVRTGGTLILADDYGSGDSLLQGIGLSSRFTGSVLTDPLFNAKNSFLAVAPSVDLKNVSSIVFNYATTLSVSDPGAQVLASSSEFSYLYPTQPGSTIANAPHGPFPVLAKVPFGKGEVYLISDASVFINSMMIRSNAPVLKDLAAGTMLLDTSHFTVGPATIARDFEQAVYSILSTPEFRYSIVVVGVAAILAYRFKPDVPFEEEELKTVAREHPEWSEERLRKLQEELAEA